MNNIKLDNEVFKNFMEKIKKAATKKATEPKKLNTKSLKEIIENVKKKSEADNEQK